MLAAALAVSGCVSGERAFPAPPGALYLDAAPPAASGTESAVRLWGDETSPDLRNDVGALMERRMRARWEAAGRPSAPIDFTLLALSGGGPDGAFAAGLLTGWSQSGERPAFDVVTGISVGALIAPFAFVGPEYDPVLRIVFTEFGQDDVATLRPGAALFGALGLADTSPLRSTLERLVDAPLVERIAEAHREGRRLLIGTTNLDAERPVIWNMGAIAEAGDLDLFRDVMLASAAIPGAFPPVAIEVEAGGARYEELHVDGGVTHSVVLGPAGTTRFLPAPEDFAVRRRIYVIQNNALLRPYRPVEPRLGAIALRSLSTLIRGQSEGDLLRIALQAEASDSELNLAYVPPDFTSGAAAFDSAYMQALFDAAEQDARDGYDWVDARPALLRSALARADQ
jgi:predicted acylesterase/phospholipase RssA